MLNPHRQAALDHSSELLARQRPNRGRVPVVPLHDHIVEIQTQMTGLRSIDYQPHSVMPSTRALRIYANTAGRPHANSASAEESRTLPPITGQQDAAGGSHPPATLPHTGHKSVSNLGVGVCCHDG